MINFVRIIIDNSIAILILILILFFLLNKFKKIQIFLSIFIFLVFYSPLSNLLVYSVEKLNSPINFDSLESDFDKIVILSGFEDIRKTKKFNQIYLGGTNNRIIEGTRVNFKFKKKIIFSGSNFNDKKNVSSTIVAKKFFESFNLNDQIIIDANSKNTNDTFLFLKKNFKSERHLIVTSAMHMQRCKLLLKKNKLKYVLYPVDFKANHENIFNFSLDIAKNIHLFNYGLREISALLFYKLSGKI